MFWCCETKSEAADQRVKIDTSENQTSEFMALSSRSRYVEAAPTATEPPLLPADARQDVKENLKGKVVAFGRSLRQGVKVQQASDGVEVTLSLDPTFTSLTVERPSAKPVQFALARTEVLHGNELLKESPYRKTVNDLDSK